MLGPHWTEVLTEILFGFLTQSSNLMRQVVDIVYPSIIPHLTDEAFQMLTDVSYFWKLSVRFLGMAEISIPRNLLWFLYPLFRLLSRR